MDETGLTINRILAQNSVRCHYVLDGSANIARGRNKDRSEKPTSDHQDSQDHGIEFCRTVDEITKKAQLLVRDLDPSVSSPDQERPHLHENQVQGR